MLEEEVTHTAYLPKGVMGQSPDLLLKEEESAAIEVVVTL